MGSSKARAIILGILVGVAFGVGGYTFIFAKGASYLTNNPEACVNCHIMREQYDGWLKSSHRAVAVCNDCHAPHALLPKYYTKALNGFWHSYAFTTGRFPDPIQITPRNHAITEQACRTCHRDIVQAMDGPHEAGATVSCLRCHRSVGHMH